MQVARTWKEAIKEKKRRKGSNWEMRVDDTWQIWTAGADDDKWHM